MSRPTALTAKPLSLAERRANVAALVKEGKITEKQAALIDFREPTAREREIAASLRPAARRALKRRPQQAA